MCTTKGRQHRTVHVGLRPNEQQVDVCIYAVVLVTRSKLHSAPVKCIFVRTREARVAADVVRALTTSPASADVSLHEKTDSEEYDVDIPARL